MEHLHKIDDLGVPHGTQEPPHMNKLIKHPIHPWIHGSPGVSAIGPRGGSPGFEHPRCMEQNVAAKDSDLFY